VASLDFESENWVVGLLTVSLGGATLCYKFGQYRVNRCVKNKKALNFVKNHANCLRHCENVESNIVASFLAHPACMP